ncbi:MAG: response regulator [Dehalogenimonas sp.]
MPELLTVREVADYLRVTQKTVYRLLQKGTIPALKVSHSWRFDKAAIDEWLKSTAIGAKTTILVIDDDQTIRDLFRDILEDAGHNVVTAGSGAEALEYIKAKDFALVFLDLKMPGMNGADVLRKIRTIDPELPVTIITGFPDSENMAQALSQGPFGVMNKPFGETDVLNAVKSFIRIDRS